MVYKKNQEKKIVNKCMLQTWICCEDAFAYDETALDYVCNYKDKFQSKTKYGVAFPTDECLATLPSVKKIN